MFDDYESGAISFYKKSTSNNMNDQEAQTDEFELEVEDKALQLIIRKDAQIQTVIGEGISQNKNLQLESPNLKNFLEKVYIESI